MGYDLEEFERGEPKKTKREPENARASRLAFYFEGRESTGD